MFAKNKFAIYHLIRYIHIYTENKPYQCYLCSKPYNLNNSFNYHLKLIPMKNHYLVPIVN